MMANHISMRVPGEEGAFLINAYGMMYEEITASSLIKIDVEGNILSKPDFGELNYGINKAGYVIHSAVHAARPELACVIHTHSWASMAVSALECGLLPITQTAMRFLKIGYHDYQGVVLNLTEQESLLRDIGNKEALILRNHGAMTVGAAWRSLQLDAPAGTLLPGPARRHGLQHAAGQGRAASAGRNLEQLPARHAPPLWLDGVARAAAQAGSPRPELQDMNTSQVIIQYLAAAGIRHIFGYPGDPSVEFLEAARRENMTFVLGSREGTAGLMAQAYGQLTGRPGVCLSTLGPGATNLVNAVANAYLDRVPMLAISGQIECRREPYFTHQVVDHNQLFTSISKWTTAVQPNTVGTIMRKALRIAMAERPGPVHLTTAADVVGAEASDSDILLPPMQAARTPQIFSMTGVEVDPVKRLKAARRP